MYMHTCIPLFDRNICVLVLLLVGLVPLMYPFTMKYMLYKTHTHTAAALHVHLLL